ncbi:MAG TPA: 23S rRNA (adenine(2503)-C(2))-methyltransferase RlmN [Phycisphaerae bacterium]|nr:23S rRNA (adenine(2503)-C(2))-methyltransferase RlmN [Phycisphaerae bacterium]
MRTEDESIATLAMTLAEYAAARGQHPQNLRPEYRALMRHGEGLTIPAVSRRTDDPVDGTVKFCLPVADRRKAAAPESAGKMLETESVIIPMTSYRSTNWHTLCISSQVGCRMGCTFCETGRMGLIQNLSAGEIVRQRLAARLLRKADGHMEITEPLDHKKRGRLAAHSYFADGIQNIVFMGMGEPLDNFDNVTQAIRVFAEPQGMNFPMTQITVSTVGRVDGLRKLGELRWPNLRIAISLNAAHDKLRDELMPVNKGMPLADLKQALLDYPMSPRGRYLIEYVLIKGVNDSPADARAVAAFCGNLRCIVNVIPYNPQRYAAFETPTDETILAFMGELKSHGIFVKRRITHGRTLMGACGQLGNPEIRRVPLRMAQAAAPAVQ